MLFKDVAIGKQFVSAGAHYRKCSEKKAHLLDDPRDGAGPLRFREDQEVELSEPKATHVKTDPDDKKPETKKTEPKATHVKP